MQNFRGLVVWQKAHELIMTVYRVTKAFPREEVYGLVSQMRRAGVSVAANIAEGCVRDTDRDFGRFLAIALGSASEVEYLLLLSHDLGWLDDRQYDESHAKVTEVKKMLTSFIQTLRR